MSDFSMDTAAPILTQPLTMELMDHTGFALPLAAELQYDARDPYAVVVVFDTARGLVRWCFGRDLLMTGLHEPTGDGDVHVWPCVNSDNRDVVVIELTSSDGCAMVQARLEDVSRFVDRFTALVAPGTESDHVDVDAAIVALLGAA
jgi:hypothetical protein